jgi:hypothetical protein
MSRSASAAPRSPATVEKRTNSSVFLPTSENGGLGVFGDILGDREGAEGARALGVHAALGDHLAVEMRQLLQEPHVLQQHGAARAGGHAVLVVGHGRAGDEYRWLEESLRKRTRELNERVKELECLYAVGRSLPRAQSLAELLLGVCESLPRGFQYPAATRALVEVYGQRFHLPGFKAAGARAARDIVVRGEAVGALSVHVEPPRGREGPPAVLPEEERLLEMVAALLGRLVEEKVGRQG